MIGDTRIIVILQILVFLGWAWQAFGILLHLRRLAQARTGRFLNGPGPLSEAMQDWFEDPAEAPRRRQFAFLTAVVFLLTLAAVFILPEPPAVR